MPIEVENSSSVLWKENVSGYVWGGAAVIASDIHLTPQFFGLSPDKQAGVIVHEATHKWAGTVDLAYESEKEKWNALSTAACLANADSYAWLCEHAYVGNMGALQAEETARMEAVARVYSDEIWAAYAAGEFTYYEEGFEVSSGQWVSEPVVGGQLRAHVLENASLVAELDGALDEWTEGDLVLASGATLHEAFVDQLVGDLYGG